MEVWGLILNGIGAILVAIGQADMDGSLRLWLNTLELEKATRLSGQETVNIVGADEQMNRSLRRNRIFSKLGWFLFVLGIVMQLLPHFHQILLIAAE